MEEQLTFHEVLEHTVRILTDIRLPEMSLADANRIVTPVANAVQNLRVLMAELEKHTEEPEKE